MDSSYLIPFQPYDFLATLDLSYGSNPTFSDFEMPQSPCRPETYPEPPQFDQQSFGLGSLDLDLTGPILDFDQQFTTNTNKQGSLSQSTILTQETPSKGARSTSLEASAASPTSSQSRKKAQNRAAQRAFRERRQLHNNELKAKARVLEQQAASLADEHARLKKRLAKVTAWNTVLQARLKANAISGKMPKAEREQQREPLPPDTPTSYDSSDEEYSNHSNMRLEM